MKKNLTKILISVLAFFATVAVVYAANNFPTSLNSYSDGDIIESDWANQLESRIGVTNSSVVTSHDYKIRRAVSFDVRELGSSFARVASLSFAAAHFSITNTASVSEITLDWGAGGPASLSQAETITGNWVNTDNPWADNEVVNTLTIDGGVVTWTDLTTYPTGCSAGQFVSAVGDTLTCATGSVASNSIDFDEIVNSMTLDANLTIASTSNNYTIDFLDTRVDIADTTFLSNGNVGIGTTGPQSKLDVRGVILRGDTPTGDPANAGTTDAAADFLVPFESASYRVALGMSGTGLYIQSTNNNGATTDGIRFFGGSAGTATEVMRIQANGNVGIGTTSPNRTLSVSGTASISSDLFLESTLQGGNVTGAATAYNRFGTDTTSHAGSIAASNDLLISGDLEVNGSAAFDGFTQLTNASVSSNFEVGGYASASKYYGGGLTDCDAATSKLLWDTTNGVFSCGTDDDIPDQTDYVNLAGGTGIAHAVTGTLTLDATEVEAVTWGAGGNATNIWTFNLTAGDPTLTWTGSGASFSLNFETLGYASASKQFGSTLSDCDSNGSQLLWSDTGLFSCQTLADADIPDTITLSGGTIGSNNISAASTWTTLGTLTIGDNGDNIVIDSNTWDISGAGVGSGFTGFTSTGDIDLGGAELEISNGTGFTFDTVGEIFFDTTAFEIHVASAAANSPRVIPTMVKLWSGTIASTSNEWNTTGRIYLGSAFDNKYNIQKIFCSVEAGTSVVINVSSRDGTYDTEQITCTVAGASDTSIDTNSSYGGFTTASSSLEITGITGSVNWLNFTIYGTYLPQ